MNDDEAPDLERDREVHRRLGLYIMAVIVSDATPLSYLVEIGAADVLPQLYGRVIILPAVRAELNHAKTPKAVREWLSKSPTWLETVAPSIISPRVFDRTRRRRNGGYDSRPAELCRFVAY